MAEPGALPLSARLASLRPLLGKKATFARGVGELREVVLQAYESAEPSEQAEMFALVQRVKTLLVSRYTSPPAWRAGCGLFLSAISFMEEAAQLEAAQRSVAVVADELIQRCAEETAAERAKLVAQWRRLRFLSRFGFFASLRQALALERRTEETASRQRMHDAVMCARYGVPGEPLHVVHIT